MTTALSLETTTRRSRNMRQLYVSSIYARVVHVSYIEWIFSLTFPLLLPKGMCCVIFLLTKYMLLFLYKVHEYVIKNKIDVEYKKNHYE